MKNFNKILLLFVIPLFVYAEHYDNQFKPKSLVKNIKEKITKKDLIATELISAPNIDSVLEDDKKQNINMHNRFGVPIKTAYNMENSGNWDTLTNGDRIWRLRIFCPDAHGLNFTLSNVFIPENAQLFIYDENMSEILGAITSRHNKVDKIFDTYLIRGDKAIFEYYIPAEVKDKGTLEISWTVYGIDPKLLKGVSNKKNNDNTLNLFYECGRDANCTEGDDWCREKRSVVKFWLKSSSSQSYWLTGSSGVLINDLDNTFHYPYILTSAYNNDVLPNYFPNQYTRILFNRLNEECEGNSISSELTWFDGASFKAKWNETDGGTMFALVQMMTMPAADEKIYYAPWHYYEDITSNPEPQPVVTVLHHPVNDPMNISVDANHAVRSDEDGNVPDDELYWKINTTHDSFDEGSEGAPFFNAQHEVIAQMEDWWHTCGEQYANDMQSGGRLSKSWLADDFGADINRSLHNWLAPNWSSGDLSCDGRAGTVHIYGRNLDLDVTYPDDISPFADGPGYSIKYFNIDTLIIGGGDRPIWNHVPFEAKLKDTEIDLVNPDIPINIELVSPQLIRIRPCTKIHAGVNLTAKIKCDNSAISDNDTHSYSTECYNATIINPEDNRNPKVESIYSYNQASYYLFQNKPNPFENSTVIPYYLREKGPVKITVFNSFGIQIAELVNNDEHTAGKHNVKFEYSGLEPGIYFYSLQGKDFYEVKKMLVVK